MDNLLALSGEATIEEVFVLPRRGRVLVFAERFQGTIAKNGSLRSGWRTTPYTGPEFVDSPGGTTRLAVVVSADADTAYLHAGSQVSFETREVSVAKRVSIAKRAG